MIQLRTHTLEDASLLHQELGKDPIMWKYTGWNPYETLESSISFIQNDIDEKNKYSWIIEDNQIPVGIIGAYDYDAKENTIEIGYSIFKKYWSKGYASKALSLVCEILKEEKISKLIAWSAIDNIASSQVLEKNGFIQTKINKSEIKVDDSAYDQVIYEKIVN